MSTINFATFIAAASGCNSPNQEIIVDDKGQVFHIENSYFDGRREKIPEIRGHTWRVFLRDVLPATFSKRKIDEIVKRYDFQWAFKNSSTKDPLPFVRRYVEVFGVGKASLKEKDLCEQNCTSSISTLTSREIKNLIDESNAGYYIGPLDAPRNLRGGPKFPYEYFVHDPFPLDKKRVNLYKGMESLTHHPHASLMRLAMAIIDEMPEGSIVSLLIDNRHEIYKTLQPIAGDGLLAVPLVPLSSLSQSPSILAFCPTPASLGALDAVLRNLNNLQKHNGLRGYECCKDHLNNLMNNEAFRRNSKPIVVIAYSQGVASAGYFLSELKNIKDVREAILFNGVSNADVEVAEEIARKINDLDPDDIPPAFYIYRGLSESGGGDFAQSVGNLHPGHGIRHPHGFVQITYATISLPHPHTFLEWSELHGFRFLEDPDYKRRYSIEIIRGEEVDFHLDNRRRGKEVAFFEEMRQKIGVRFLYTLLNFFNVILTFIFRMFNVNIFRTSR